MWFVCVVREQLFLLVGLDDYSLRLLSKVVRQRFVTISFCDIMKSITGGVKNFLGAHIVTYMYGSWIDGALTSPSSSLEFSPRPLGLPPMTLLCARCSQYSVLGWEEICLSTPLCS